MNDVRVVLNRKGIAELLRSKEVRSDLYTRGKAIAAAAGEGHEVALNVHKRARVSIRTVTPEAMESEATDRTLTRSLDAGR